MCLKLHFFPAITIDFLVFFRCIISCTHVFFDLCLYSQAHYHMPVAVFSFLIEDELGFAFDEY